MLDGEMLPWHSGILAEAISTMYLMYKLVSNSKMKKDIHYVLTHLITKVISTVI